MCVCNQFDISYSDAARGAYGSHHSMVRSRSTAAVLLCATALLCTSAFTPTAGKLVTPDPLSSVNTLIGAGGVGFQAGSIAPGPQVPFGAMRLSPDTSLDSLWLPFQHFGGYSHMDTHVRCFSHTHMVGSGIADFGNFGVQAVGRAVQEYNLEETAWYRSAFSHETETAVPGLYTVTLEDPAVDVRLTVAGTHSGLHEYTFLPRTAAAPAAALVFDICTVLSDRKPSHACPLANLTITPSSSVDGSISISAYALIAGGLTSRSSIGGVHARFHARVFPDANAPVESIGVWQLGEWMPEGQTQGNTTSGSLGAYIQFAPSNTSTSESTKVLVYVGISFVNASMAEMNLLTQMSAIPQNPPSSSSFPSFEEVLAATQAQWAEMLGVVEIQVDDGLDEEDDSVPLAKVTPPVVDEVSIFEPASSASRRKLLQTPPSNATYTLTFYGLNDTSCEQVTLGAMDFDANTCVRIPDIGSPYHSLQLYDLSNASSASSNYSLNLYLESPFCDDFVGWFTNGTLGTSAQGPQGAMVCQQNLYWSWEIAMTKGGKDVAKVHQPSVQPTRRPIAPAAAAATPASSSPSSSPSPSSTITPTQFYSLLYHSLLSPTTYTESGGVYRGMDHAIHSWKYENDEGEFTSQYYSDFSLWDTHRTQNPLLGLLYPAISRDIIRSMYTMYSQGGDLPRWPLADVYTGCMSGDHGLVTITDGIVKDVRPETLGFPASELLQMAYAMIDTPRPIISRSGLSNYTDLGYVSLEADEKGAALTLEYAMDDWAVSVLAEKLGDGVNAERLLERSKNYKNVWNTTRQTMCPRSMSGEFVCPSPLAALLPYPIETGYTEADAWQEMWFVPSDPRGLISLFPSTQTFVTKLKEFVERGFEWIFPHEEVPNDYYWSGNEPDILAPWLFAWAGRADLTQNFTRELLNRRYTPTADIGLPGNDDYGTISAWATWASIGLYPQAGNTTYILGSPVFPRVTIHRAAEFGGDLILTAEGTTDQNRFVLQVKVNGQILQEPFVQHKALTGAMIEFTMTSTPSKVWNTHAPTVDAAVVERKLQPITLGHQETSTSEEQRIADM